MVTIVLGLGFVSMNLGSGAPALDVSTVLSGAKETET
jgi:hypothetical protein